MTETGISEVLQHLIDTLQLEGHELFRIFTEVQFALAIQNFLLITAAILGSTIGLYVGYKLSPKVIEIWNVSSYEEGMIRTILPACGFVIGLILFPLLVNAITSLYLSYQYLQYYAAKELIRSLTYIN